MSTTAPVGLRSAQTAAAYGGLVDALGGIATAVLAIIGMTSFDPEGMAGIATIVLGAALLIQGGTIFSEYANCVVPFAESVDVDVGRGGGEGLSAMLLAGASGIVLGVLALLGIAPVTLIAVATIVFGSALILGSNLVRQLYMLQLRTLQNNMRRSGKELLAGQFAAGTAGLQLLIGLAAVVLGVVAVAGGNPVVLSLAALLLLGVTVLLTGSTLSGLVASYLWPSRVGERQMGSG